MWKTKLDEKGKRDMMKEKTIKEMEKVLVDRIIDKTWRPNKVAKELYEIIVPEGSVVISKEEYECLRIENEYLKQRIETKEELDKLYKEAISKMRHYSNK